MRVKEHMIADPVAATVPSNRRDVVALFRKHGYAGFPVIKEGTRKLAGVVTRLDLFDNPDEQQTALLMNPNPATTYAEAPLTEAARLVESRHLRILPVVNGVNDLMGLVTPAELLGILVNHRGLVAGLPRRKFVPVYHATPAPVAFEMVRTTRATALPVLDDRAKLCGIITDGDLLRASHLEETAHLTVAGTRGDHDAWAWESNVSERKFRTVESHLEAPPVPVSKIMVREVVTVTPSTPIREAAALMAERHLNQLPVLDEKGRCVDLLTDLDLLATV